MKLALRTRSLAWTGALLALAATAMAVTVAAASPAAGDTHTITFYKASRAAMAGYQGIDFTGGGTSYRVIHAAGGDVFKFDFGEVPTGYSAATAHVRVVARGGLIIEEVDTLFAPGKPPLRLWRSTGSEVGELLGAKPCPELVPANPASFATIGSAFVTLHGTFAPLAPASGGAQIVASSYRVAGGTAQERDTIDAATHLWRSSRLVIKGGPYAGNSLEESAFSYRRSQRFLQPPGLRPCN